VPRDAAKDRELLTLPEVARETKIAIKRLRAAAKFGDLTTYTIGTAWPRTTWADVDAWIRSTRVRPTDHSRARVEEVLAAEQQSAD